jgi:hypothetical protein
MEGFQEIKKPLEKIIIAINSNEELQRRVCNERLKKPNVEDLERASCNHLFTDYPNLFGIKEIEGAKIRDYIQTEGARTYEHVILIRENFHKMLSNENPNWINQYVNPSRIKCGLKPIRNNYPD